MGFLRYMRESIGKRLTVKHLTTVCLQSDKGQVKQLSLYSHTVFFAAFRRTLWATVHFGAHIRESGALIRSCARTHLSVLIWEHLLPKSSRSRSTVIVAPMSITFPSGVCTTGSVIIVHSVTSMLCISSLTDAPDRSATKEKRVSR